MDKAEYEKAVKHAHDVVLSDSGYYDTFGVRNARALLAANKVVEAARPALEHLQEMRDAWQRGYISTHNNTAAQLSNGNMAAETAIRLALRALDQGKA